MKSLLPAPTTADRGLVLVVAALCGGLVIAATLSGLWLRTTADDLAATAFRSAGHQATQLQVTYVGVEQQPVGESQAAEVAGMVPSTMRSVLAEPRYVVTTTEMVPTVLPRRPGEPAYLSVGALPNADSDIEIVDGRHPRPGDPVRTLPPDVAAEYDGPPDTRVVEVLLEESAAVELEMPLGSWVALSGRSYSPDERRPATLHVVGTFRAAEPYPSPVDDLDALRKPLVSDLAESNLVRATALAADEETVLGARWEELPDVRFAFDLADAPDAATTTTLVEEARRSTLQTWPPALDAVTVDAGTGLGQIAETAVEQRTTSNGLISLMITPLATGGLAVLLAAAVVLASRRSRVTDVMRARGAGPRRLVALRGAEALLLTAPGVVIAAGLAAALSPDGISVADLGAALVTAVVAAGTVTAAQTFRAPGEQLLLVVRDASQLGVALLAAGAVALVLAGDGVRPDDPVMLLIAPLIGAAAAVVMLRLLQAGLATIRPLLRRTRAATVLVGLSQAATMARQVMLPATALVLAASAGVLSVAVADSIRAGATQAGWEQVGADVAVVANGIDDEAVSQLEELQGVSGLAEVFTAETVPLTTRPGIEGVTLIAVDFEELARVGGEAMADLDLAPAQRDVLTGVASPDLELDDSLASLRYGQADVPLSIIDRIDRIPGVTDGESFVLVDRAELARAVERPLDLYTQVLVAGSPDPAAVTDVARARDPDASVVTRAGVADRALAHPVVDRTLALTQVATVASLGLAFFAVMLAVGLGAHVRRHTAAVLGMLGGSDRQRRRAGILGLVPVVATACLAAGASGVLLSLVAGRGIDLSHLTGSLASVPVRPDPLSIAATAAVLVGLVIAAAVAVRARRTTDPSHPEAS